jgi:sortase A
MNNSRRQKWYATLIILIGLFVCVYPYAARYINSLSATRLIAAFEEEIKANSNAGGGEGALPDKDSTPPGSSLAIDGDMIAILIIPRLGLELPVFTGNTDANLARGIAHVEGTSMPIGGKSTHSVLAGHNGAVTNEWFTRLDRMQLGDPFYIKTKSGEVLEYSVFETRIINPSSVSELLIREDEDIVTLLTCTSDGSQRLIVVGERVLLSGSIDDTMP